MKTAIMNNFKSKKLLIITSRVLQLLLSFSFFWAGGMKLFQPIPDLSLMWPWTGDIREGWVRFIGLIDVAGACGLLLPTLFRYKEKLVFVSALAVFVMMMVAAGFHIYRGELSDIGINIFFALCALALALLSKKLTRFSS